MAINFKPCISISTSKLSDFTSSPQDKEGNPYKDNGTTLKQSVRIVGSVKNEIFLVTWINENRNFTIIAEVDLADFKDEAAYEILLQAEGKLDISHATLNSSRSVLGITVRIEKSYNEQNKGISYGNAYTYQSFLTKLPQNQLCRKDTWFSLTDSHSFIIQLHFLHSSSASTESDVVTLVYRHSIQLHKIDHSGAIRLTNNQVLALDFLWAQWIEHQQCLAFLSLQTFPGPKKSIFSSSSKEKPRYGLSCIQFSGQRNFSTAFIIPADNFLYEEPEADSVEQDESLSINKISYLGLNLSLILWKEGSASICYQKKASLLENSKKDDLEFQNNYFSPSYIITSLNHGCYIKSTFPLNSESSVGPFIFSPCDEHQLIVLSQTGTSHIVDLDPCHEPGYCIVCSESNWPFIEESKNYSLVPIPEQGHSLLIKSDPCYAYIVSVRNEELLNLFSYTKSLRNRKSITHLLTAHVKPGLADFYIRKLMKRICFDPWHPHIKPVFEEFLKSSTFSKMKRNDINFHSLMYHLPLMDDLGQTQMDFYDRTLPVELSIQYSQCLSNLPTDSLLLASSSSSRQQKIKRDNSMDKLEHDQEDFWHTLWHHQISLHNRKTRSLCGFDFKALQKEIDTINNELEDEKTEGNPVKTSTPIIKTPKKPQIGQSALCSFCINHNLVPVNGERTCPSILNIQSVVSLPFEPIVDDFNLNEKHIRLFWKALNDHLQNCCPLVAKSAIDGLCSDYITAQVQQSHILCHAIFHTVEKYRNPNIPSLTYLCSLPYVDLLQCLLELYYMSCQNLSFSVPSGFHVVFCEVTFHAFHFDLFIQHIQAGIVKLQMESVKKIIKALDESPQSMKKKLICIGYLRKDEGEVVLKKWKSRIGERYKTIKKAREGLGRRDASSPDVQNIREQDIEFLSLNSSESEIPNEAEEVLTPD